MSFAQVLDDLPLQRSPVLRRFEALISAKSDAELEALAQQAHALTLQNFGRTMRLFARWRRTSRGSRSSHLAAYQ
jgi:hypothetical protein